MFIISLFVLFGDGFHLRPNVLEKTALSLIHYLQTALLFTHSWRENSGIHIFPKGIVVLCEIQAASSRI